VAAEPDRDEDPERENHVRDEDPPWLEPDERPDGQGLAAGGAPEIAGVVGAAQSLRGINA
jgi:hypothetical protein